MGIRAANIVINPKTKQREEAKPQPKEVIVKTTTVVDNITEPSVIVDGKVKKISKKSAFLLDMLSLDD